MSSMDRSPVVGLPLVGVLGLVCIVAAQERPPICEQIAKTYGLASFPQVEQIRYTFNVDLGQIKLSRSWLWEPKVDRVSYEGKDKNGKTVQHTYLRSQRMAERSVIPRSETRKLKLASSGRHGRDGSRDRLQEYRNGAYVGTAL